MDTPSEAEKLGAMMYEHYTVPVINNMIEMANNASPFVLAMVPALRSYIGMEPLELPKHSKVKQANQEGNSPEA